jgi:hypothetical protein
VYLPRGVTQPVDLSTSLNAVQLPPTVVKWRYTVDDDWTGDPSLFFWITLADRAAQPQNLHQTTKDIIDVITQRVDPRGQWGLIPYFNFRSQTEQAELKEEVFG